MQAPRKARASSRHRAADRRSPTCGGLFHTRSTAWDSSGRQYSQLRASRSAGQGADDRCFAQMKEVVARAEPEEEGNALPAPELFDPLAFPAECALGQRPVEVSRGH